MTQPSLGEILTSRAERQGDRIAFRFLAEDSSVESVTYGGLELAALSVATDIRAHAEPGDRVALVIQPGLDFVVAFFACCYVGVAAVPVVPPGGNRRLEQLEHARGILEDAAPKLVVCDALFAPAVSDFVRSLRLDPAPRVQGIAGSALTSRPAHRTPVDPASPALLQYTSGSTGTPKGVVVTHANLVDNVAALAQRLRCGESDVGVSWLPAFHDMGLIGAILMPVHAGFETALLSPLAFLKRPLLWLRTIERFRATISPAPNFAFDLCVRRSTPEERAALDLSTWRVAPVSAEPVRKDTIERFARAFEPSGFDRRAFVPCYGLAEATLAVTACEPGGGIRCAERGWSKLVACGKPIRPIRIVVVDPDQRVVVPEGAEGEIWVAGTTVCAGYHEKPAATEATFGARLAGGEGPFLRSGDLGLLQGGELFVSGRLKDVIIARGRKHYPQDLERTLESAHAALRSGCSAAVAIHAPSEERLAVVAEVRCSSPPGAAAADSFEGVASAIRRAVAVEHGLTVHDVLLVPAGSIPKTSSGKIRRRACAELMQHPPGGAWWDRRAFDDEPNHERTLACS